MRLSFGFLPSSFGDLGLDLDLGLQHQPWVNYLLRPWRCISKGSDAGERPFFLSPSLIDTLLLGVTTSLPPSLLHFASLHRLWALLLPLC